MGILILQGVEIRYLYGNFANSGMFVLLMLFNSFITEYIHIKGKMNIFGLAQSWRCYQLHSGSVQAICQIWLSLCFICSQI